MTRQKCLIYASVCLISSLNGKIFCHFRDPCECKKTNHFSRLKNTQSTRSFLCCQLRVRSFKASVFSEAVSQSLRGGTLLMPNGYYYFREKKYIIILSNFSLNHHHHRHNGFTVLFRWQNGNGGRDEWIIDNDPQKRSWLSVEFCKRKFFPFR